MRHHLTTIAAACCLFAGTPAYAQLFQVPAQRTIVLAPGWHLAGPPVRSDQGLRFAVRSDAGVMRDMTVLRSGAITFSGKDPAQSRDDAASAAPPREIKTHAAKTRPAPKVRVASRPAPTATKVEPVPAASRIEKASLPQPETRPAPVAAPKTAAITPAAVTPAAVRPATVAPATVATAAASPAPAPTTVAAKPARAPEPAPSRTGPDFAHGVPINPLE